MSQDSYGRDLALRVFQWVLGARRPLHIKELIHATALEDGQKIIDPDDLPTDDADLLTVCRSLVRLDKQTSIVEFIHSSVIDFLLSFSNDPMHNIHYRLSKTCLDYLMLDCFQRPAVEQDDSHQTRQNEIYMPNLWGSLTINEEDEPDRFFHFPNGISKCAITQLSTFYRVYPFFRYAALYWPVHVSFSRQQSLATERSNLVERVSRFYKSSALVTWVMGSAALEARVLTLAYNLEEICCALHHGYIGTSILDRKEKFEDLERFSRNRKNTRLWKPGFFTQYFSTIVKAQQTCEGLGDNDNLNGMCGPNFLIQLLDLTRTIGQVARDRWLRTSLHPMLSIFLFALAYVCLDLPTATPEIQMEHLNLVTTDTILSTAALSSKPQHLARASYSVGITGLFVAGGDPDLTSLQHIGRAIRQEPMSARFGYAYAIIHRRCRNYEAADECAITVWCTLENPRVNLFFRRTVARAYERRGELELALSTFDQELEIWGLWTKHLDRLLVTTFAEKTDVEDVISLWKKLNARYLANESNLMSTLVRAADQTKIAWDPVRLWNSVLPHTVYLDTQRVVRGKFSDACKKWIYDENAVISMVDELQKLDNSTLTNGNNVQRHKDMLIPLIGAYDRLEQLNRERFWKTIIERNPLSPKILSIIREKYSYIEGDPACPEFWMAMTDQPPRPIVGWVSSIVGPSEPGPLDCSVEQVVAALDYLSDYESADPTVRKKQHFLVSSLVQRFNFIVVDDRLRWCPMRYLACKHISDERRDTDWAYMILDAIWDPVALAWILPRTLQ